MRCAYGANNTFIFPSGHPKCPCVNSSTLEQPFDLIDPEFADTFGGVNLSTFGLDECAAHESELAECLTPCQDESDVYTAVSRVCDKSYCKRKFCLVDHNNCDLEHGKSTIFKNAFYSYATCGEADSFTGNYRIQKLNGRILDVVLLRNSGGWKGSYSTTNEHHKGPWNIWSGLAVEFIQDAARQSGIQLRIVSPPTEFREQAEASLGSSNVFAQCVHAAALGYVDLCVASFTINTPRALAANFIELDTNEIYLIVSSKDNTNPSFHENLKKVFAPFLTETWVFIICFVIPVLGLLTLFHEYGNESFPKTKEVVMVNDAGVETVEERPISFVKHMPQTIYRSLLATLRGDYDVEVSSIGGHINIIGILFFIVVIIATYTANLASFFTLKASRHTIDNIDDAIAQGWRFCMVRTHIHQAQVMFPQLVDDAIVVDPIELGGDGLPGFSCNNCRPADLVLEKLDPVKAKSDKSYCHAAITYDAPLEKHQEEGHHCTLKPVQRLYSTQFGMPVASSVSRELTSLVLKLKNEGNYQRHLEQNRPQSRCGLDDAEDNDLSPISIEDLTGMWVVTFGVALVGVLCTLCERFGPKKPKRLIYRGKAGKLLEDEQYDDDDNFLQETELLQETTETAPDISPVLAPQPESFESAVEIHQSALPRQNSTDSLQSGRQLANRIASMESV